jgi:uncharacterized protein YbjT (DUF2867 family)
MQALVVGATGYTGGHVVRELCARQIEAAAHVRPDSPRLDVACSEFEALGATVDTTPWEQEALQASVGRIAPDLVFSLLGTTRHRAREEGLTGDIYEAVEGRLTTMLIDAVKVAAPQARFVFLSSMGTKPESNNAYLAARARIERHVCDSGISFTIARAPIITGPDRRESRLAERLAAVAANTVLSATAVFGGRALQRRFASMTGAQLAKALVHAALDPSCVGEVLEPERLREFIST